MRFSYSHKQILLAMTIVLVCIAVWFELAYIVSNPQLGIFWKLGIIGLTGLIAILARLAVNYGYNFLFGEKGELSVDKILANNLPNNYIHLHDITLPGNRGNIDEVVISPYGVWTLEVKNSSAAEITFENDMLCRNHYPMEGKNLKQAYAEAKTLEEYIHRLLGISVSIHPVLVFANSKVKLRFGNQKLRGVNVIGIRWLRKLLVSSYQPNILTNDQCLLLTNELRKYISTM